jgi:hypothetical protein
MNPWLIAVGAVVLLGAVLGLGWTSERRRLRRVYAPAPPFRWADRMPELSASAASLDTEWRELGYEPVGTLERDGSVDHVYVHPTLPVYALISGRAQTAIPWAISFWEGGGTLLTTAVPWREARDAAVDTGTARLVQLRVDGRPVALDGQHVGTVRAWALGKRVALPATKEALTTYLQNDLERVRAVLGKGKGVALRSYLRAAMGRPERILTF